MTNEIITRDMIEYPGNYDEDYAIVTFEGERYRFTISRDDLFVNPGEEYDCYSESDLQAFRDGEWWYVYLVAEAEDIPENKKLDLSDALGGVEFGDYTWNADTIYETKITFESLITQYPGLDMILNIQPELKKFRMQQAIEAVVS